MASLRLDPVGRPVPQGSKTGFVVPRKGARVVDIGGVKYYARRDMRAVMKEQSSDKLGLWRACIERAARAKLEKTKIPREVFEAEDFSLSCIFRFQRPKSHFGTGRNAGKLKKSAPRCHVVKPDLSKLVRAVEDALTGIIWRDDSQVIDYRPYLTKGYADDIDPEGVCIRLPWGMYR